MGGRGSGHETIEARTYEPAEVECYSDLHDQGVESGVHHVEYHRCLYLYLTCFVQVIMASAILRNLPPVLSLEACPNSAQSSTGLRKRRRRPTAFDALQEPEPKLLRVSPKKDGLALARRTRATDSSSLSSSRNGRRAFAPLSGLKNFFTLRPPIISSPAITSLFTFVQPMRPLNTLTKLVGGLSFTKNGNFIESSTSNLTTRIVKARIPRNDYVELLMAPKLELNDVAKSQLREEACRARYEEEKAEIEKEKGYSMRKPEVLMWIGRKRSKALYEYLALESENSERLTLLFPEYDQPSMPTQHHAVPHL